MGKLVLLKEKAWVADSDVIGAVISSAPDSSDLILCYRGKPESWEIRHAAPDDRFVDFLKTKKPSLYECLRYLSSEDGLNIYYMKSSSNTHIFIYDGINGAREEDFLPVDAKHLPQPRTNH